VAVSRGYFTRVFTVETADPETNPEILSWKVVMDFSFTFTIKFGLTVESVILNVSSCVFDVSINAFVDFAGAKEYATAVEINDRMNPRLEHSAKRSVL